MLLAKNRSGDRRGTAAGRHLLSRRDAGVPLGRSAGVSPAESAGVLACGWWSRKELGSCRGADQSSNDTCDPCEIDCTGGSQRRPAIISGVRFAATKMPMVNVGVKPYFAASAGVTVFVSVPAL
jgi:hypothetical protein